MGEALITRRGGGSGKAFAVIHVEYPAGSVCTCTNGSKTLKANDTSGLVNFLIPSAGDWVVSCTDGTDADSKTVSITTEGQGESVKLDYGYYLFRDGALQNGYSMTPSGNGTAEIINDSIHIAPGSYQYPSFSPTINLTDFSRVFMKFRSNYDYSDAAGSYQPGVALYLGKTNNIGWEEPHSQINTIYANTEYELAIDTSNMRGDYYLQIRTAHNGAGTIDINVWELGAE